MYDISTWSGTTSASTRRGTDDFTEELRRDALLNVAKAMLQRGLICS